MASATFIEDWNSIMTFKIKASDLERPTEGFVHRTVLNFFNQLHYDVAPYENMYSEHMEVLLPKRAKLVAHVNYIYQLCLDSKNSTFLYADLIKPSPKKTVHLLNILLNYLFYINMVKESVLEKSNACTEKYFEALAAVNEQQIAKENNKIIAHNIEQNINDLKGQLGQLERQTQKLAEKKTTLQERLVIVKANDHDLMDKLIKLKLEHANLREQKITDEEAALLIENNEQLAAEIEQCNKSEKNLLEVNAGCTVVINRIRPCLLLLEKILQSPFDDSCKILQQEVEELKLASVKLEKEYVKTLSITDALESECTANEMFAEEKRREYATRKKMNKKSERSRNNKFNTKHQELVELQEKINIYQGLIEMEKTEIEMVVEISEEAISFLKLNYREQSDNVNP